MAAVSATCVRFGTSLNQSTKFNQIAGISTSLKPVAVGWTRRGFPSLRTSHFRVSCAVEIVMELEEAFSISVEEESSQNITSVQEAADLIDILVQKKSEA
ncbi:hypothetical protein RJ640_021494 [Escallonia rubra]|uniref:Acyl carrier protein n=1 Tax=Escallonia rubra TaxID=112253 RepID=A0AA88U852_9ASTE|nr:hypothetical protein RJ640_021494 [Escallonia rubra]